MDSTLEELVRRRAGGCCEYCRTPQDIEDLPAEIDHIIAEVHGGGGQQRRTWRFPACIGSSRHDASFGY